MTMVLYMTPARSQGKLYAQRLQAVRDTHRWVFVNGLAPEVKCTVRKWLTVRLVSFYCDLQVMYTPHLRLCPIGLARTHIVLNNTPPPHTMAKGDEAVEVGPAGNARDTVKALIKATGLNPHLSVCGWPFCLDDLGGIDDTERGMI